MANYIDPYDPIFYAQEALIQLEPRLAIANRVYRQLDQAPQQKGSKIQVRRPSTFVAEDMPPVSDQELAPEMLTVELDQHKGVQFAITDKELTFTRQQMIDEHIRPAAVAVAKAIDLSVVSLYKYVPWYFTATDPASTGVADLTGLWQVLFDNEAPEDNLHLLFNGERTKKFMELQAFSQYQGAGDQGVALQTRGSLGMKYGFDIFSQQSVQTHASADPLVFGTSGALNANIAVGATSLVVKDITGSPSLTGSVAIGDTFVIAGDTQRYVVNAAASASGNLVTVSFEPAVKVAYSADDAITFDQPNGKKMNLAFHRNFACLAMAALTEVGDGRGADIATIQDPKTNITLRARVWYDAGAMKNKVSIDALWGVKLLDYNLACRYQSS